MIPKPSVRPSLFFLSFNLYFKFPTEQLDILAALQMQSNKKQILSAFRSFSWVLYCGKGATVLLIYNPFLLLKSIQWPNSRDYVSKVIPLVLYIISHFCYHCSGQGLQCLSPSNLSLSCRFSYVRLHHITPLLHYLHGFRCVRTKPTLLTPCPLHCTLSDFLLTILHVYPNTYWTSVNARCCAVCFTSIFNPPKNCIATANVPIWDMGRLRMRRSVTCPRSFSL